MSPGGADVVIAAPRAGNPWLDWLNITDSSGAAVSHYRLMLDPPFYNALANTLYAGIVELAYTAFLVASAYASAALRLVTEPRIWLQPLSEAYVSVTTPIYEHIPPNLIVVAAFAILILQVFVIRTGPPPALTRAPKPPTLMDQWIPSNTQIARAQWDRLSSGLVLMALVWMLTANPFKLIQTLLEWVVDFGELFTGAGSGTSAAAAQGLNTADLIRTATFLINYRDVLDAECTQQWASSINHQGSNPGCLTPSQVAATSTDHWTVVMALAALPVGFFLAKFAFLALTRFVNYVTLAVLYLVATSYVAAVSLARRRPYDPLVTVLSRLGTYSLLSAAVLLIAVVIPGAIFGLINGIFSIIPETDFGLVNASVALLKVAAVTAAYYFSALILSRFFGIKETVLSVFKDRVAKNSLITNLYDLKPADKTFTGPLMAPFNAPTDWVKGQYGQVTSWSQTQLKQLGTRTARGADSQEGSVSTTVDDTPEMAGAQQTLTLGSRPAAAAQVHLDALAAAAQHRDPAPAPVVLTPAGERLQVPASPAGPHNPTTPDAAVIIYRGGVPAMQLLQPPITPAPAPPPAPQPATAAEPATEQTRADARAAHLEALHADARSIQPTLSKTTPPGSQGQEIDSATTTFDSTTPAAAPKGSNAAVAAAARRLGILQGPNFTMLLSAAAWTRAVRHQRNLLAARGIDAIPTLSDQSAATEHVIFSQRSGRSTMVRKHDRGFGDEI